MIFLSEFAPNNPHRIFKDRKIEPGVVLVWIAGSIFLKLTATSFSVEKKNVVLRSIWTHQSQMSKVQIFYEDRSSQQKGGPQYKEDDNTVWKGTNSQKNIWKNVDGYEWTFMRRQSTGSAIGNLPTWLLISFQRSQTDSCPFCATNQYTYFLEKLKEL